MSLSVEDRAEGATFEVRVVPRAQPAGLAGTRDGRLLVRVAAAPVDGEANEALVRTLAKALHVARGDVRIIGGERSRTKRLLIAGRPADAIRAALAEETKE